MERFDKALAVGLVATRVMTLTRGGLALLVGLTFLAGDGLRCRRGGKGQPDAIRRPDGSARAALERRQLAGLAAVE